MNKDIAKSDNTYEFCPRCEANLTLQKGYSNDVSYWICRGCGEMLINPNVPDDSNISWICDKCEAMLNIQAGFSDNDGEWKCTECGFVNKIDPSEIYLSDDEYRADLMNPYRGITNEDLIEILSFEEIANINGREDIVLVKDIENDQLYVKKFLSDYDYSVYEFIKNNPIDNMPKIYKLYRGRKYLIIIEEYIEGKTISDLLDEKLFSVDEAVDITKKLCVIARDLHKLSNPIIHRDIKPSNVIITERREVFLLDINVAKWYKPDEAEDTKMFGTLYYAAPEQFGYGFSASSDKSDIYALGMLLNVMITGKLPKEEKASGLVWPIVEKCISLDAKERYSDDELLQALTTIREKNCSLNGLK